MDEIAVMGLGQQWFELSCTEIVFSSIHFTKTAMTLSTNILQLLCR